MSENERKASRVSTDTRDAGTCVWLLLLGWRMDRLLFEKGSGPSAGQTRQGEPRFRSDKCRCGLQVVQWDLQEKGCLKSPGPQGSLCLLVAQQGSF